MLFRKILFLILSVAGMALASPASAQNGVRPLTQEQLDRIPTWKPPARGVGDLPFVDLRDDLPPVANQGQQPSCSAWAVAYAARTHMEARTTGRKPDRPERQFSPAFVYNQIPKFSDGTTNVSDALEFLKTRGCSTLATMSYDPNDKGKTQPSASALSEAANYRIAGYKDVDTGVNLRTYLQQRRPVIVVINNDSVFTDGKFKLFTPELRKQGLSSPGVLGEHASHAMVVVGYDDQMGAFLLMNSWGPGWGQGGYCWVSYKLMTDLTPSERTNLCVNAFVLEGLAAPVDTAVAVAAEPESWYAGHLNGSHTWGWRMRLAATPDVLAKATRVDWTGPGPDGTRHQISTADAALRFEVAGLTTKPGTHAITGTVTFTDGTTRQFQAGIQLDAPATRAVKIAQSDRYWGVYNGRRYHEFTLRLDGTLTDLADVEQVTYHLHPNYPDPNPVVRGSKETGFAMTHTTGAPFELGATVKFRDGATMALKHQLQLTDVPSEGLRLTNTSRMQGLHESGWMYYNWTAFITGPSGRLRQIKSVQYFLDPSFPVQTYVVAQGMEYGFPLSASGWGSFRLGARVTFQDGTTEDLVHQLQLGDNQGGRAPNPPAPVKPPQGPGLPPSPDKRPPGGYQN